MGVRLTCSECHIDQELLPAEVAAVHYARSDVYGYIFQCAWKECQRVVQRQTSKENFELMGGAGVRCVEITPDGGVEPKTLPRLTPSEIDNFAIDINLFGDYQNIENF